MNARIEFPQSVRKAAWARAGGICECGCGRPFSDHPKERPHYDHVLPARLGGDASLENCKALRVDCHQSKTVRDDLPRIKKVRRGEKDRANLKAKKAIMPGSRRSQFKRRIDGTVIRRDEA